MVDELLIEDGLGLGLTNFDEKVFILNEKKVIKKTNIINIFFIL
jgi:hypothetical protein